jgi:hypothetical protein
MSKKQSRIPRKLFRNFKRIFLAKKIARKSLILTKIREKMLLIFFSSLSTKNVKEMLEKHQECIEFFL